MIEVPPAVAAKAREVGAAAWLTDLPSLVAGLERDWQVALGAPYPDATEAYVAPATLADGTAAVLKVLDPAVVRGRRPRDRGVAARRRRRLRATVPLGRAAPRAATGTARAVAVRPRPADRAAPRDPVRCREPGLASPADTDLPDGATKARWLAGSSSTMWERLDRPCSERAVAARPRLRRAST